MIIKQAKSILLSTIVASLVFGSGAAIPQRVQDEPTPKRQAQGAVRKQEEGRPAPDVIGHWQALATRSKGPLAVTWNKRSGTPHSIIGKIHSQLTGGSEMTSRAFLKENAKLFKMSNDTLDLMLIRANESLLGQHYVFQQTYQGIPVYGSEVSVHFNKRGEIVTVNNAYEQEISLEKVVPDVSREAASRVAITLKGDANSQPTEELVVLVLNDRFTLTWRIVLSTDGPTWEVFVDAQSGQLVDGPRDINRYVTGTGQVFTVNAVVAT